MISEKSWAEFKDAGLLWFINTILHLFGWVIVLNIEDGKIIDAYPARTAFRGFSNETNTEGYIKLSDYLKENIDEIAKEARE